MVGRRVSDGVAFTNLDQPLFDGANATKRDLVDYLDGVADRIVPALADRPLSVIRVHRGQEAFMQKNLPKYAPEWIKRVTYWAETSKRDVAYALCNDKRTLMWFANQRAVEFHPALVRVGDEYELTHLVLDLDPPPAEGFAAAVRAAHVVKAVLDDAGLAGALKTSGAKGLHIYVPVAPGTSSQDAAAATHALAVRTAQLDPAIATVEFMKEDRGNRVFIDSTRGGAATVVSVYSPRVRPDVPVSWPFAWDDIDDISPADFTIHTALGLLGDGDPWAASQPPPRSLPPDLIAEGAAAPPARVEAMHEGLRRARSRRAKDSG